MTSDFAASMDAAAGPLKRLTAITSQIGLSVIPADAGCCCLCSVYEPHLCEGWRGKFSREVPSAKVLGMQPPPVVVPVCNSCAVAKIRKG